MKRVFADAVYWVALAHPRDQWHQKSVEISQRLGQVMVVTTDEVLDEFLAFFSGCGSEARMRSAETVRALLMDPTILVLPQTRVTFQAGLTLYEIRPDKSYSLTDCISMTAMREHGIVNVLTHDMHFAQEGFNVLL